MKNTHNIKTILHDYFTYAIKTTQRKIILQ